MGFANSWRAGGIAGTDSRGIMLAGLRPGHGQVITQTVIDQPVAQVFRWLAEDDQVKKWVGGLEEVRPVSSPADGGQVGRKFRTVETYKDQRAEMEMTVTKFEKDRALSILVSSVGDPSNGFTETGDYTLTEENGRTRLKFAVQTKNFWVSPAVVRAAYHSPSQRKIRRRLSPIEESGGSRTQDELTECKL